MSNKSQGLIGTKGVSFGQFGVAFGIKVHNTVGTTKPFFNLLGSILNIRLGEPLPKLYTYASPLKIYCFPFNNYQTQPKTITLIFPDPSPHTLCYNSLFKAASNCNFWEPNSPFSYNSQRCPGPNDLPKPGLWCGANIIFPWKNGPKETSSPRSTNCTQALGGGLISYDRLGVPTKNPRPFSFQTISPNNKNTMNKPKLY